MSYIGAIQGLPRIASMCLLSAAFFLPACGATRSSAPELPSVPLADTSLERGKRIYDANCLSCHAQGEGGMGPALNNKPLPEFLVRFQVRHGIGAMPAFSDEQLSDRDLHHLARYVTALRKAMR